MSLQIIKGGEALWHGERWSGRSVNSSQLERWLGGSENLETISKAMKDWPGPPIALQGVPGKVFAHRGGDFRGDLRAGYEASARDRLDDIIKRYRRGVRGMVRRSRHTMHGFTSLGDLIQEASAGKRREFQFQKSGPTGVANVTTTLWRQGAQPAAGSVGAAAPGGTVHDDSNTGAFAFTNPSSGDTQHFVAGFPLASVAGNTLLLCDRLTSVGKTMASTATEAVTGVPTRYQNTTGGQPDSIAGNMLTIEVGGTALAATAHNWTVCQYTDNDGNTAQTLPLVIGASSAIADRLDQLAGQFFCPLATNDTGIKALTQMQCSASVATGVISFVISHPLAWMPCPIAAIVCPVDGINTAFNLARIYDDACMYFLEVCKPSTTGTNYTGSFTTVAG